VDEVNLLRADVADAILDAAAQGVYTVRRGPIAATYRARFELIGSMNPEEGMLRPQIADRFGLRAVVTGLRTSAERWEAYQRAQAFSLNPRGMIEYYREETETIRTEILAAHERLPRVELAPEAARSGLDAVQSLGISSLRGISVLFEAARAYAAADGRDRAVEADLAAVAVLALRMRRSPFMDEFSRMQEKEDDAIRTSFASPSASSS
jgi:Mg-chelatase subunit ChlI